MASLKRRSRAAAAILVALAGVLAGPRAAAGDVSAGEYQIKAAYLRHFAQFVDWPQSALPAGAPIVIGLIGRDPFGRAIDEAIAGKHANGHPLVVRRLRWNDSLATSQVLFVSSSELEHLGAILAATRGFSVLTVSDVDGFAIRGGIIELTTVQNRIDFEINTGAAAEAHLRISSKLLQIARAIRGTVDGR
jgi:hypothetical protein